jgi:hypothetical protein
MGKESFFLIITMSFRLCCSSPMGVCSLYIGALFSVFSFRFVFPFSGGFSVMKMTLRLKKKKKLTDDYLLADVSPYVRSVII